MKQKHIDAYMKTCEVFAGCSSGVRLKVGSVIVKNNRIISCGYNALPGHIDGSLEDKSYWTDDVALLADSYDLMNQYQYKDAGGYYKLVTKPEVRHAEKNALMGLTKSTETSIDSIMFCTHSCCYLCAVDIVDAGIKSYWYKHDYRDSSGLDHLRKNGVEVIKYEES